MLEFIAGGAFATLAWAVVYLYNRHVADHSAGPYEPPGDTVMAVIAEIQAQIDRLAAVPKAIADAKAKAVADAEAAHTADAADTTTAVTAAVDAVVTAAA